MLDKKHSAKMCGSEGMPNFTLTKNIQLISYIFLLPCCICHHSKMFFEDKIDDAKYCGHLYGLGTSFVVNGNSNAAYTDNGHTSDSTSNS